jgi:hypothetical protein
MIGIILKGHHLLFERTFRYLRPLVDYSRPASCDQSDVNAAINGPTHPATHGDTIYISSGSRKWTTGVTVQSGTYVSILGIAQDR